MPAPLRLTLTDSRCQPLALAYRHAEGRFTGHVWYAGPQADSDIATALFNLLFEIEQQLNAPDLGLTST